MLKTNKLINILFLAFFLILFFTCSEKDKVKERKEQKQEVSEKIRHTPKKRIKIKRKTKIDTLLSINLTELNTQKIKEWIIEVFDLGKVNANFLGDSLILKSKYETLRVPYRAFDIFTTSHKKVEKDDYIQKRYFIGIHPSRRILEISIKRQEKYLQNYAYIYVDIADNDIQEQIKICRKISKAFRLLTKRECGQYGQGCIN